LSCCKEEVVEEHLILMATDFGIQQLWVLDVGNEVP
jgi:hypothetical protein